MSSSSVCQGLQSCLEPRLVEPRVLRIKLAPAKSNFTRSIAPISSVFPPELDKLRQESHTEGKNTTIAAANSKNSSGDCEWDMKSQKSADERGWSFLQFLTNTSHKTNENEKAYVHPLVKRSYSTLSDKSLEMCTESLGSETGTQVIASNDAIPLVSPKTAIFTATGTGDNDETPMISPKTAIFTATDTSKATSSVTKRMNRSVSFPPPLNSISGSSGVRVRPHREGGRLLLQAVTVSSNQAYFHAERRDGRLRICLVRDSEEDDQGVVEAEEEEEEEEEIGEEESDKQEKVETKDAEKVEARVDKKIEARDDEKVDSDCREGLEAKNVKVSGQIGGEKFPRPSNRCKEGGNRAGNNGLVNLEPFWVAS